MLRYSAKEPFDISVVRVGGTKSRFGHRRFHPLLRNGSFLHDVGRVPGVFQRQRARLPLSNLDEGGQDNLAESLCLVLTVSPGSLQFPVGYPRGFRGRPRRRGPTAQ